MSRRRRHKEHVNHERWLVSYADLITLLFAFFVVMYSTSQVDHRKVGKLAAAIQVAFQELGVFQATGTKVPTETSDPIPPDTAQALENVDRTAALGRIVPAPKGVLSSEQNDLSLLRRELEQALAPEISRHEIALRQGPDGLVISLREIGFFDSGSAQIKTNSQGAFSRIASLLVERNYRLRIEGHTDNVPIHTPQFASNWELSTGRGTELIRLLVVQYGFAPERLSVGGYAEFHPIASNSTEEGRALNRRVDVVILSKPASAEVHAPEKPTASDAKPASYLEPQAPPSF